MAYCDSKICFMA